MSAVYETKQNNPELDEDVQKDGQSVYRDLPIKSMNYMSIYFGVGKINIRCRRGTK